MTHRTIALLCLFAVPIAGCSKSSTSTGTKNGNSSAPAVQIEFPDGDPSVSAEDGGPGFTGEGWATYEPAPQGDPAAVKGGTMQSPIYNWPDNLRMYGIRSNTQLNYMIRDLCFGHAVYARRTYAQARTGTRESLEDFR